jgi:hypothetical protein
MKINKILTTLTAIFGASIAMPLCGHGQVTINTSQSNIDASAYFNAGSNQSFRARPNEFPGHVDANVGGVTSDIYAVPFDDGTTFSYSMDLNFNIVGGTFGSYAQVNGVLNFTTTEKMQYLLTGNLTPTGDAIFDNDRVYIFSELKSVAGGSTLFKEEEDYTNFPTTFSNPVKIDGMVNTAYTLSQVQGSNIGFIEAGTYTWEFNSFISSTGSQIDDWGALGNLTIELTDASVIPEPSTVGSLACIGLAGLLYLRKRKRKAA